MARLADRMQVLACIPCHFFIPLCCINRMSRFGFYASGLFFRLLFLLARRYNSVFCGRLLCLDLKGSLLANRMKDLQHALQVSIKTFDAARLCDSAPGMPEM